MHFYEHVCGFDTLILLVEINFFKFRKITIVRIFKERRKHLGDSAKSIAS